MLFFIPFYHPSFVLSFLSIILPFYCPSFLLSLKITPLVFTMTTSYPPPTHLYYTQLGPVHFLMLGSYAPHTRDSEQYRWLIQDLAHLDRSKTPWVIAAMHAPWYNSNTAHYGEGNAMQVCACVYWG